MSQADFSQNQQSSKNIELKESRLLPYSDLHEDFSSSLDHTEIFYAWVIFAGVTMAMLFKTGPAYGIVTAIVMITMPLIAHWNYRTRVQVCQRLSLILKNTEPVTGKLKIFKSTAHITKTSDVLFVDVDISGTIFKCAVVSQTAHKIPFSIGEYIVPVHCSPETGQPAVAIFGEDHMWLESRPF